MPTVIDSLVIELGLDPTKFTKNQRTLVQSLRKLQDDMEKGGKEMERRQSLLADGFRKLKGEALAFLSISFGGAAARRFFDFLTNADAAVGRTSRTLDESVVTLSAWQG